MGKMANAFSLHALKSGVMKLLDFDVVKRQIIAEYLKIYGSDRKNEEWNMETVIEIFGYYYNRYSEVLGREHPHLSSRTINNVIRELPHIKLPETDNCIELSPADYEQMIDSYLDTRMEGNHSIAHFMSGNIRLIRFYEVLYR